MQNVHWVAIKRGWGKRTNPSYIPILRKAPDWSVGMKQWWSVWRAVPFWTILNTKWNGLWTSRSSTNLFDLKKSGKKNSWRYTDESGWSESTADWETSSCRVQMVYRSPIAPFLLTEDEQSEEGPTTKAKDSAEKKPIKGIEIHISKPPERAESHWPWRRKATGLRSYRAN